MADARRTAVVARNLAELEAKLVSLTSVKVIRDGETVRESMRMVRKWERISDRFRADYEAYLRGQEWLTDPMADQEKRTGRWRVLRVYSSPEKTNPSEQGIYQMLLYWPEDYGDFGEYCAESSPLAHTDVEIFHDSPELADCAHEIEVGTVFSATNRLDPETGLWSGEKREDISREYGSGLSSVSGGPLVAVTETERRNAEAPPTGRLTTPGQSRRISWSINRYGKIDWTQADEVQNASATHQSVFGGLLSRTTRQEKRNDTAAPTSEIGSAGTIKRVDFSIGQSALIDWSLTEDAAQPLTSPERTTGSLLVEAKRTEGRNASVPPVTVRGAKGTVTSGQFSINQYGWYDWATASETGHEMLGDVATYGGRYETTQHEEGRNSANPKNGLGEENAFTRGNYSINQYGLYDWSLDTVCPVLDNTPVETNYGTVLVHVLNSANRNQANPANPGPGTVGTSTRESFSINQYGLIDWNTDVETAQPYGPTQITFGGVLSSTVHKEGGNAITPENPGAGAAGVLTRGGFSINRYGLFDWSTDTETAIASAIAEQTYGGALNKVARKEQRNSTTIFSHGVQSAGKVSDGNFNINAYGLFDWSATLDTATASIAYPDLTFGGPLTKTTRSGGTNYATPPAVQPGSAGFITRMSINLNRYGWYDWTREQVEAIASSETYSETSTYERTDGVIFQNQTELPSYPEASGGGTPIQRVSFRVNDFGLFDGSIQVTSATEGFQAGTITLEDSYQQKVDRTWFFNQESAPTGATKSLSGGDVTVKTFSPELNKFNLWDYSETTTIIHTGASATNYFLYGPIYTRRSESATTILYQQYKDKYTHTIAIHKTLAAAQAAISGKHTGSSAREIGAGIFMSDGIDVTEEFQGQTAINKK